MTSAFQTVIDMAESISIDTRAAVAQTQSRDGTVRAISQGAQPWTFTVRMPDGPRWSDLRTDIAKIEALDRYQVGDIQISATGHSWMTAYQGDAADPGAFTATFTSGNTITLTNGQAASGYNFRAGDFIQLGTTGAVYKVAADVPYNVNTVTLHRPVRDAVAGYNLLVGQAVTWSVICTQLPAWTIFARDQVSWNGAFVFVEDLS